MKAIGYLLLLVIFPGLLIYKNPGEITVWFYGMAKVSATGFILLLFAGGTVTGILFARLFNKQPAGREDHPEEEDDDYDGNNRPNKSTMSKEDRDYIS